MSQLSPSEIQELATQINSPCISIYMPAEKAGSSTRENPIRFKNLLSIAEKKVAQEWADSDITNSLNTAKSYLDNYDFWQNQDYGLAFLIDNKGVKYYCLPDRFEELSIVSDRFYLQPLLKFISSDRQFYLLALSQNKIQLFLGDSSTIKELDLPNSVPVSLAEALKYDDPEKQTQYHSGGSGSPVYHGQGVGTTDNKDEIKRFFQQIDGGLQSAFDQENTPLVLAGVEYLLPIYHEANSYSHLIATGVIGNPENVNPEDLQQQAWEVISNQSATEKQAAIENYDRLANTPETTHKLAEIVAAAINGQIDTLFMVDNVRQWGSFDRDRAVVEIHAEATKESVDLFNLAAVNTYTQGGKIYQIEPDKVPENQSMMAILRYPVYAETKKVNA